jgi:hypothetical protein
MDLRCQLFAKFLELGLVCKTFGDLYGDHWPWLSEPKVFTLRF